PQTPNPKPQTPNPKPQTPNPKPQIPNPKPYARNPKPLNPNTGRTGRGGRFRRGLWQGRTDSCTTQVRLKCRFVPETRNPKPGRFWKCRISPKGVEGLGVMVEGWGWGTGRGGRFWRGVWQGRTGA
ncbi:hypothetical protein T484DRAFT_1627779, partial [Baffinella frigidus]